MNAHQRRLKERGEKRFDWKALRKAAGKLRNVKLVVEMPTQPTGRGFPIVDLDWHPGDYEQMKSRLNRTHGNVLDGENLIRESVDSKLDAIPLHDYQLKAMEHIKSLMPERGPVFVLGESPGLSALMAHRRLSDPHRFLDTVIMMPSREVDLDAPVTMTVHKSRGKQMPEHPFEVDFDFDNMKFNEPEKNNDDD